MTRQLHLLIAVAVLVLTAACGGTDSPIGPSAVPVVAPAPTPPPPPPAPLWSLAGNGNQAFDVPLSVTRLRIRGVWNGVGTSNFIVHIGGGFTVNAILRELPERTYDGTHNVRGGSSEIVNSGTVAWTLEEMR